MFLLIVSFKVVTICINTVLPSFLPIMETLPKVSYIKRFQNRSRFLLISSILLFEIPLTCKVQRVRCVLYWIHLIFDHTLRILISCGQVGYFGAQLSPFTQPILHQTLQNSEILENIDGLTRSDDNFINPGKTFWSKASPLLIGTRVAFIRNTEPFKTFELLKKSSKGRLLNNYDWYSPNNQVLITFGSTSFIPTFNFYLIKI